MTETTTDRAFGPASEYRPDPDEEAYYSSAEGLQNEARLRREHAARLIAEAEEMERQANG